MKVFQGVIVPMVTPIHSDYSIDVEAVKRLVDLQLDAGCAPFVLGTTGEAASLSPSQKLNLVRATCRAVAGRQTVFAGISGTSLIEAVEQGKVYKDLGVDVLVTTLPYYYPITPREMLRFFETLADQVSSPLVIYNMPAMVGESIPLEIADQLSDHDNIVGLKDSERNIERVDESLARWAERADFAFYLGWAAKSAHCLLYGADGIVPSTANFVPHLYQELYQAGRDKEIGYANRLQVITNELSLIYQKSRGLNASLPALKVILSEMGLCQEHVLPPMSTTVQDEQIEIKKQIRALMDSFSKKEASKR